MNNSTLASNSTSRIGFGGQGAGFYADGNPQRPAFTERRYNEKLNGGSFPFL